jgi:glycosyltransferase involved in cell wall biosynthesis
MRDWQPEVVHAATQRVGADGAALARSLHVPCVITVHHLPSSPRQIPVGRRCQNLLAISQWMRQSLVNKLHVGKGYIEVVPYGVDPSRYRHGHRETPALWTPVVGTYGRLRESKGVDVLLKAVRLLKEWGRDVEVLVVGDGPMRGRLLHLADKLDLRRRVTFYGDFSPTDETIPSLDIYIQPDLTEAFGIELVEAMVCGLPVVASAAGGVQEIIKEKVNGLLVRPGDANALARHLGSLIENAEWRQELGDNAREHVEQYYSLDRMLDAVEASYENARAVPTES